MKDKNFTKEKQMSYHTCSVCNGSGYMTCPRCGGDGRISGETCYYCQGQNGAKVPCSACNGSGKIED